MGRVPTFPPSEDNGLPLQRIGRKAVGTFVRSVPLATIGDGGGAWPHSQTTGTMRASSTTAGRTVRMRPRKALLALLPKVIWIAPSSSATDVTIWLTIFSAGGSPAATLSDGRGLLAAHEAATAGSSTFASGNASATWFRAMRSK
jgi:hypothetical protein